MVAWEQCYKAKIGTMRGKGEGKATDKLAHYKILPEQRDPLFYTYTVNAVYILFKYNSEQRTARGSLYANHQSSSIFQYTYKLYSISGLGEKDK